LLPEPLSDEVERVRVVAIEVHQQQMRPPTVELGLRDLRRLGDPGEVLAVIQGEGNEVRERLVGDDQDPRGSEEAIFSDPASIRVG
jgi:hypothetical protein